jgi:hypothetical protein
MTPVRPAAVLAILLFACSARLDAAAVTISPSSVYLDSRTRTTTVTLYNPGEAATEVSISFAFGYPQSDATGTISVALTTEPPPDEPSAHQWLRAFPRRMVLAPGQRQVVRVIATPPPDLPPGEYWARLVVTSRAGSAPVQGAPEISAQLNVVTHLVTAANFRHGAVTTGVEILRASATRDGDRLLLELDLERAGNAAFLGRLRADLLDANGIVRGTHSEDVAVYRTMLRRLQFDLAPSSAEPTSVRLTLTSGRDDLPSHATLAFAPLIRTIPVTP